MTAERDHQNAWPAVGSDLSQVSLHFDGGEDDEDRPERRERSETGPAPNATSPAQVDGSNDVARLVGGSTAAVVVLGLVDKALAGTGVSAADVAEHLGPMLGALYNTYPVVGILFAILIFVVRSYRREQAAHRRRDRRLQTALSGFGKQIAAQIGGLRRDVANFTSELGQVKQHVEERIGAEVRAASRVAGERADRTDHAISELRLGLAEHNTRLVRAEVALRLDAPPDPPHHAQAPGAPTHARRVRAGRAPANKDKR